MFLSAYYVSGSGSEDGYAIHSLPFLLLLSKEAHCVFLYNFCRLLDGKNLLIFLTVILSKYNELCNTFKINAQISITFFKIKILVVH